MKEEVGRVEPHGIAPSVGDLVGVFCVICCYGCSRCDLFAGVLYVFSLSLEAG